MKEKELLGLELEANLIVRKMEARELELIEERTIELTLAEKTHAALTDEVRSLYAEREEQAQIAEDFTQRALLSASSQQAPHVSEIAQHVTLAASHFVDCVNMEAWRVLHRGDVWRALHTIYKLCLTTERGKAELRDAIANSEFPTRLG